MGDVQVRFRRRVARFDGVEKPENHPNIYNEREAFLARLYSVCPPARQLSDEGRCRWVMGDELPREIENSLYRYLIAISKLRLGILTEQGEGS